MSFAFVGEHPGMDGGVRRGWGTWSLRALANRLDFTPWAPSLPRPPPGSWHSKQRKGLTRKEETVGLRIPGFPPSLPFPRGS